MTPRAVRDLEHVRLVSAINMEWGWSKLFFLLNVITSDMNAFINMPFSMYATIFQYLMSIIRVQSWRWVNIFPGPGLIQEAKGIFCSASDVLSSLAVRHISLSSVTTFLVLIRTSILPLENSHKRKWNIRSYKHVYLFVNELLGCARLLLALAWIISKCRSILWRIILLWNCNIKNWRIQIQAWILLVWSIWIMMTDMKYYKLIETT